MDERKSRYVKSQVLSGRDILFRWSLEIARFDVIHVGMNHYREYGGQGSVLRALVGERAPENTSTSKVKCDAYFDNMYAWLGKHQGETTCGFDH